MSDHVLVQVCQDGDEEVAVCKCGVKKYAVADSGDAVGELNEHIAAYEPRAVTDQLTTLHDEVVALRAEVAPFCEIGPVTLNGWIAGSYVAAYDRVLDLIDKHTREGQ